MNNKIKQSIKIIQLAAAAAEQKGDVLELCYSGGKDSDVMLRLAQMADVTFEAIYKQTTIDPPGTTKHVLEQGATIIHPKKPFLKMIERNGFPTRRARWCCERFKEYKIHNVALVGVRAEESRARAKRYTDISVCRHYHKGGNVEQFLPIVNWTLEDIKQFVISEKINLHPHYYDNNGELYISRRLGCIGCPLRGDRGKEDFRQYPKLFKQWYIHGKKWFEWTNGVSPKKFGSVQKLLIHNLFCRSYQDFLHNYANSMFFTDDDALSMLEKYFDIELR